MFLVYTGIYTYIQVYTNYKSIYLYIQVYTKIIILIQCVRIPDEGLSDSDRAGAQRRYSRLSSSTRSDNLPYGINRTMWSWCGKAPAPGAVKVQLSFPHLMVAKVGSIGKII